MKNFPPMQVRKAGVPGAGVLKAGVFEAGLKPGTEPREYAVQVLTQAIMAEQYRRDNSFTFREAAAASIMRRGIFLEAARSAQQRLHVLLWMAQMCGLSELDDLFVRAMRLSAEQKRLLAMLDEPGG